jgi:putative membrane protein
MQLFNLESMEKTTTASSVLTKILLGGISVLIADFLLKGVSIDTWTTGFLLAAMIILINFTLKPIMVILTLPITLITLGLFLLVINACVILLAAYFIPGFSVESFWWALGFSVVLSLINGVFGNSLNS